MMPLAISSMPPRLSDSAEPLRSARMLPSPGFGAGTSPNQG
jgi:hypothetical protein